MNINPAIITQLQTEIEAFRLVLGDDDQDELLRADMLEGETSMDRVLSRIIRAKVQARADGIGAAEAKKAAFKHYDRRMAIAERANDACDNMIRAILSAAGLTKFAVPEGKISIIPGKKSLELSDGFVPPQGYSKTTVSPDNAAIKSLLESGSALEGATLVTGKPTVRIV